MIGKVKARVAPYNLSAMDGLICAQGPSAALMQLGNVPGNSWREHPDVGRYITLPASRWTFMACEAVAAASFVSDEYRRLRAEVMDPQEYLKDNWKIVTPKLRRPMMKHQADFCALAYGERGYINASEQGTGKTATGCALMQAWNMWRSLIVCPRSLMHQWEAEFAVVVDRPSIDVVSLDKGSRADKTDVIKVMAAMDTQICLVLNYETLDELQTVLVNEWEPNVVIFDESWRIKNRKAKVTKAAYKIVQHAHHVLCMTGTPVGQSIADLWSQLRVIRGHDGIEPYDEFVAHHAKFISYNVGSHKVTKPVGLRDPIALMENIEPSYFRATKATCLDLPEKLPVEKVFVDLPPAVRKIYDQVKRDGEAALGDGSSLMGALAVKPRLQQIVGGFVYNPDGTEDMDWEIDGHREDLFSIGDGDNLRLRLLGSVKMDKVLDFVRDELEGNPSMRALVWYRFNAELHVVNARCKTILGEERSVAVTGKTTDAQLAEWKESFNSRDPYGVQMMHCQVKKMAYGHNLQAGDVAIVYSFPWSAVEWSQMGDRVHRLGRVGPVRTVHLIARNTVDEEILNALENMQNVSDRVTPHTIAGERDEE